MLILFGFAGGVAVERRYFGDILDGLNDAGLCYGRDWETTPALVRA